MRKQLHKLLGLPQCMHRYCADLNARHMAWVLMITFLLQSLEAIEEQLLPMRKQLHQLLGLPKDRPMLRIANAMSFDDAAGEACGISRLT